MAHKTRTELQDIFRNRKKPDENDFADVFDSSLNRVDDGVVVDPNNNIGIGYPQGSNLDAKLSVDGSVDISESATVKETLTVQGGCTIHDSLSFANTASTAVDGIVDDVDMGGYAAEDKKLVTQHAIKSYVNTRLLEEVEPTSVAVVNRYFVGSIAAFALKDTDDPPEGWLFCDGASYNKQNNPEYDALFTAIEQQYGPGDGSVHGFNVPDLRGIFVRGLDNRGSDNADPDRDNRTQRQTGATIQNVPGGYQSDGLKEHVHNFTYKKFGVQLFGDAIAGSFTNDDANPDFPMCPWGLFWWFEFTDEDANTNGVDIVEYSNYETRPKNMIFMYCIKY